jgi:hypothetical protein
LIKLGSFIDFLIIFLFFGGLFMPGQHVFQWVLKQYLTQSIQRIGAGDQFIFFCHGVACVR